MKTSAFLMHATYVTMGEGHCRGPLKLHSPPAVRPRQRALLTLQLNNDSPSSSPERLTFRDVGRLRALSFPVCSRLMGTYSLCLGVSTVTSHRRIPRRLTEHLGSSNCTIPTTVSFCKFTQSSRALQRTVEDNNRHCSLLRPRPPSSRN